jgi:pimeloyl-ACP methyl ester carboxylesterase
MSPIHSNYTNEVPAALSKTDISKIKVLDSRKTTSALRTFRFSTGLVRHAVVVLLVSLGSCSLLKTHPARAAFVGDASSAKSASPGKIAWQSCEGNPANTDCAQVQVPLDWNHPDGPEISLAVARHRASKPDERIGSLFVNFGGPGVPGVPAVLEAGADLDKLGAGRFDVVGWDPRGTGDSTHVRCFENEKSMERFWGEDWTIPSTPASEWRYVRKTLAYVERCADRSGSLLEHISTADTVRDLDYLRQLAGDAQLTYRGLSYGTVLGQTYINMFPKLVRAIILDANIDPVQFTKSVEASLINSGGDTDLVFEKFLSLCEQAGQANCKLAGDGDVAARVRTLLARLRQGPIPAPRGPAPFELRYGDALIDIWSMLRGPDQWPELADELNQAANGDGSALATTFHAARSSIQASLVSAAALQCADKPLVPFGTVLTFPRVMQHLMATNFLGSVEGWWLWAPCASWQAPSAERYTGPWNAMTENPILIIGNRYDPRTKFANSVLASRRLGNAVLLTLQGYGHTSDVDPSVCIDEAVTNFLVTKTTPPVGTICQPDHAPFDPDFGKPLSKEQPID